MATSSRVGELLRGVAKWAGAKALSLFLVLAAVAIGFGLRGILAPPTQVAPAGSGAVEPVEAKAEVWTCSMHPQIQLPKPGNCPICNMTLIPLVDDGGGGMSGPRTFTTSKAAKGLMGIQTSEAIHRFVEKEVRMVGKVTFDETKLAYITSWVPGRIDKLYVDYTGVEVRKGDHMVYLYSPELLTTQDELRRAAYAVKKMNPNAPDILKQTAQSTLKASRERLRLWGLTDGQIKAAETAENPSDHITIYAPIGGTVIHRSGQEGMYVDTGSPIYTIADLNSVWVKLDAYESHLSWIHYGQTVSFTTESYPGEVFKGKISFIDPVLDKMTRTVKVRVNVANPDGKLKPEMFVRAVVKSQVATGGRVMDPGLAGKWIGPMHPEVIKGGPGKCDICGMALVKAEKLGYISAEVTEEDMPLVVPASAPLLTGTRAIVYVEVPNMEKPTFEGREIVLGSRAGDFYIVKAGLRAGERVVTNGNFKIDSALQILAKPSMMSASDGDPKDIPPIEGLVLSFAAKEQLNRVVAAYQGVVSAFELEDRSERSPGLKNFSDALAAVDMTELKGDAHMAWMKYAARLKNDVGELEGTKMPERVTELTVMLRDNVMALLARLGLPMPGQDEQAAAAPSLLAPEAFQVQLAKVYEAYLNIQDALATDSLEKAQAGAKQVQTALEAVDMKLVEGDAHMKWMKLAAELKENSEALASAESIESAREALPALSDALWTAVKTFGLQSDQALYQAHCPMVPANWLQADTTVRNPYYGSSMLSCGSIADKFTSATEAPQDNASPAEGSDHK